MLSRDVRTVHACPDPCAASQGMVDMKKVTIEHLRLTHDSNSLAQRAEARPRTRRPQSRSSRTRGALGDHHKDCPLSHPSGVRRARRPGRAGPGPPAGGAPAAAAAPAPAATTTERLEPAFAAARA